MLSCIASILKDIALSCRSKEGATGAFVSGAFCSTSSACGANQRSGGYEFAIICLAASPYDCQAKVAATPMQNATRKRAGREARLRTNGCRFGSGSFSKGGGRTEGGSVDGCA